MNQSPLSINTKPYTVKDWPSAKQFLTDLNPTVVVVAVDQHDHFNRILEAQQAAPHAKIVARFIDKVHDGNMHEAPKTTSDKYIVSPANQLDRIRAYGKNGLIAYWGNEPDTKASIDDLTRLADHTCDGMDLAASRDYDMSLCVLNLGIGHPKPLDGFLPTWMHRILLTLNTHRNRHYYGLHVYLPSDIKEHLNALKRTCIERLKIPMPRIIITEMGYDNDGTNNLNGFKDRGITAEADAVRCVDICAVDLRSWIESGDVLGACVFIYGDDESWWAYNVETAQKGVVSTAWRDVVLREARAGRLDIKPAPVEVITMPVVPKDIEYGKMYRLNLSGKIVTAFAAPSITDRPVGTIPDNSVIEARNIVIVDRERWLQILYPTIKVPAWIKIDLVTIRETTTAPIVTPDPLPVTKPLPTNGTAPAAPDIPKTQETAPQREIPLSEVVEQLRIIKGALSAIIEMLDVKEPIGV